MSKTPDEIRAEIKAAREQMRDGLRGLSSEIHPTVIRQRTVQKVKNTFFGKVNDVKELIVDDAGIRWDRIGTIVFASSILAAFIGLLRILHKLFRRH